MSEKPNSQSSGLSLEPTKTERWEISTSEKGREKGRRIPEGLQEALRSATNIAISRIMVRVASKEWMPTDARTYRNETLVVLKETEALLPEWHVLKGAAPLIIENFLTPEERGAELILSMMKKGYALREGKRLSIGPKEYEDGMSAIRSTLGFSIDLAKTNPEKIKEFFLEIRKIPEATKLLERFPDLETLLLNILPEIAKNIDKKVFLTSFNSFIRETKESALLILRESGTDQEQGDAVMKLAHESSKLVSSILTKDLVRSWIDRIASLRIIRNNPMAHKLIGLVRHKELSDEDRLELIKKANEGIVLFTKVPPHEAELERYANSAAELVSKLSRKLPKDIVTDATVAILRPGEGNGKKGGVEIKNSTELAKLLYENRGKIPEALRRFLSWELSTVRDIVRFVVDERLLDDNIAFSKGELIERMKRIVEIDLVSFSGVLRNKLSMEMKRSTTKNEINDEKRDNLRDVLSEKILAEMAAVFFGPERPLRITKELLADRVSSAAEKAVDSMPGTSIKIGGLDIPKIALKSVVTSMEFRLFAADAFVRLAEEAGDGRASVEKLSKIATEIMKDPLGNRYTGERTKAFAINAFHTLPAHEIAEMISNNLESSGLSKYLKQPNGTLVFDKTDIIETVNILRDGEILPKETLVKLLSKETLTPPVNTLNIVSELLRSLSREQLSLLIEKVCAQRSNGSASLLEKGLSVKRNSVSRIPPSEIPKIVELVFDGMIKVEPESRKMLFERLGANAKVAEYGISFFQTFGKDRTLALAKTHAPIFGEIVAGELDPKKNPEKLIPLAVDIAYDSDFETDAKLADAAKSAFPELRGILEARLLGESVQSSMAKIRMAIPREQMRGFLFSHSEELSSLAKNFNTAKATRIGVELLLSIEETNLPLFMDASRLTGVERLAVEKLPQIRTVLGSFRNESVRTPDGKISSRLDALIESGVRAREGKLSQKEAEFFAGETFDLLSRLLPTMGEWKILESGNEISEASKKFKKEFLSKNFGFVLGQMLPYLFGRPTEEIMQRYFVDQSNKEAFIKRSQQR